MKNFSGLIFLIATIIMLGYLFYQDTQIQKWRDKSTQYQQDRLNDLKKCDTLTRMQLAGLQALDSIIQIKDAKLKVYEEAYGKIIMPGESMRIDFKIDLRDPDQYKLKQ